MKNKYVLIIILLTILSSCNKEVVHIKGELKGFNNSTVELKLNTRSGQEKIIASGIEVTDQKFDVDIDKIKPPFKLTLVLDSLSHVDFWVFKYGKLCFDLDASNLSEIKIHDCFENTELSRVNETYNTMYLNPLKEQMDWIANYEVLKHKETNEADETKLERYKAQIKKAYRLRKKSILKTVRKNTQSPVAVALMCQEYERLTSHQKKECFKYLNRTFADTGLNWQMKH